MEATICKDCRFYVQHYGISGNKFTRVYCGHCTFSRLKRKLPDAKTCEHFLPGTTGTDSFVTKEYLTKELLHYVLSLDLLPESKDSE